MLLLQSSSWKSEKKQKEQKRVSDVFKTECGEKKLGRLPHDLEKRAKANFSVCKVGCREKISTKQKVFLFAAKKQEPTLQNCREILHKIDIFSNKGQYFLQPSIYNIIFHLKLRSYMLA